MGLEQVPIQPEALEVAVVLFRLVQQLMMVAGFLPGILFLTALSVMLTVSRSGAAIAAAVGIFCSSSLVKIELKIFLRSSAMAFSRIGLIFHVLQWADC